MKIEKRLHDLLHLKRTKLKQLYVWYCTNELYIQLYVCLHFLFTYDIYIREEAQDQEQNQGFHR
jgi:hypothetical protein